MPPNPRGPPRVQVSVQKAFAAKPASRKVQARQAVVASAHSDAAKGLAAAALAATLSFGAVDAAYADVAGLTPCSESKAFAKREKNEVKALTKRLKQVRRSRRGVRGGRGGSPEGRGARVPS